MTTPRRKPLRGRRVEPRVLVVRRLLLHLQNRHSRVEVTPDEEKTHAVPNKKVLLRLMNNPRLMVPPHRRAVWAAVTTPRLKQPHSKAALVAGTATPTKTWTPWTWKTHLMNTNCQDRVLGTARSFSLRCTMQLQACLAKTLTTPETLLFSLKTSCISESHHKLTTSKPCRLHVKLI